MVLRDIIQADANDKALKGRPKMVRLLPKNRNAPLIWTDILNILIYAYNFWAPIILVPLVMALLGRHVSTPRFLWGAGAGVVMLLAWPGIRFWVGPSA